MKLHWKLLLEIPVYISHHRSPWFHGAVSGHGPDRREWGVERPGDHLVVVVRGLWPLLLANTEDESLPLNFIILLDPLHPATFYSAFLPPTFYNFFHQTYKWNKLKVFQVIEPFECRETKDTNAFSKLHNHSQKHTVKQTDILVVKMIKYVFSSTVKHANFQEF